MDRKLNALAKIGVGIASVFVPGLSVAAPMIDKVIDAPSSIKDASTQVDAAEAAFKTVEAIDGVDIGNEATFKAGCTLVEQGLSLIHASLVDHTDGTPEKPAA